MAGPLQITRDQLAADTDAAIRQALWHLRGGRVEEAVAVIDAEGPWLGLCDQLITRREREERIRRIVDDLTMASVQARRQAQR